MKPRAIIYSAIIAVPVVLLGGCLSMELITLSRARPPRSLATIEDFQAWKKSSIMGRGTFAAGATNYTVMLAPAGRLLPSGPAAYLFDPTGRFVDWSTDMGDVYTFKYQFDLTSGHVNNVVPTRQ